MKINYRCAVSGDIAEEIAEVKSESGVGADVMNESTEDTDIEVKEDKVED
ncbi:hypothetical protein [Saccharococcus sp. Marseille-Q5394]|nr:hypothetical protein [Saccharococcus sp. Marseille-Q5394]